MPEEEQFFKESKKKIQQYVEDRLLLLKLQTAEKISKLIALLFTGLIIGLLCFFVLLFISIMGAYFFANLTHSMYWGFGIVAGFYLVVLLVVLKLRKNIIEKSVRDIVIKVFFDNEKADDDVQ